VIDIDIIVPSKNRPNDIARCIASIEAQLHRPRHIIVVDQSPAKYELPASPRILHIYDPELSGLPAARNRGIAAATSDIVLFVDDDMEIVGDIIPDILRTFAEHPDAVGVQCPFRQPPDIDLIMIADQSRFKRVFSHGFFEEQPILRSNGIQLRTVFGGGCAYRRSLFDRELFDEQLAGYAFGEDWDFAKRAQRYGTLWLAGEDRLFHHRVTTNRHQLPELLRARLTNFLYFYRKMGAAHHPGEWFWLGLWLLGETYNALRNGINPLRLVLPLPRT
jgi:GT2 family glycosyltransferase